MPLMDLSTRNVDLRLAIIAAISVFVSISACIVGLIGGMPSGVSTVAATLSLLFQSRWYSCANPDLNSPRRRSPSV